MKSIKINIVIYFFVAFCCTAFTNGGYRMKRVVKTTQRQQPNGNAIDENCINALKKIEKYYNEQSRKKNIYLKYSSHTIENGEKGESMTEEIWIDQELLKVKYENTFMLLYQDKEIQVTLLKDEKTIVIRDSDNKGVPAEATVATGFSADSLLKYANVGTCVEEKENGTVTLVYPEKIKKQINPLRKVVLNYSSKGILNNVSYKYEYPEKKEEVNISYEKTLYSFDKKILSSSALDIVMSGKEIKKEYKNYNIQDFRKIHIK